MRRGVFGLYSPLGGNVGPFGFPPDFLLLGGWDGWAKRTIETIRKYQVDRLCGWCFNGNTDRQGWFVLKKPIGGEMYGKNRPQRGDRLTFDSVTYLRPDSLDPFEREVANKYASAQALKKVVGELERYAVDDSWGVTIYLGNTYDCGIGASRALAEWDEPAFNDRVQVTVSPLAIDGVRCIVADASAGGVAGSPDHRVCNIVHGYTKAAFGIEGLAQPTHDHWNSNDRVWQWANAEYLYKLIKGDFYTRRENIAGRVCLMGAAKPDARKWSGGAMHGEIVHGANGVSERIEMTDQDFADYYRLAHEYGCDTYAYTPIDKKTRDKWGI